MFYVDVMCMCCIVFNLCETLNLCQSPEMTLCGWLGYYNKPSRKKERNSFQTSEMEGNACYFDIYIYMWHVPTSYCREHLKLKLQFEVVWSNLTLVVTSAFGLGLIDMRQDVHGKLLRVEWNVVLSHLGYCSRDRARSVCGGGGGGDVHKKITSLPIMVSSYLGLRSAAAPSLSAEHYYVQNWSFWIFSPSFTST